MAGSSMADFILAMASGFVALDADDALGDVQILHHLLDAVEDVMGVLDEAPVVGGDIGLTLRAVDDQHVDLVQVLGGQLHRRGGSRRRPGPGPLARTASTKDFISVTCGGGDGGVHRLLAVRGDDHGLLGRAVGRGNGGDLGHRTGNAGVDVGGDEAPCLAHHGAHIHLVALGDGRGGGGADVLSHGQDDLGRQRHRHRLKVGSPPSRGALPRPARNV